MSNKITLEDLYLEITKYDSDLRYPFHYEDKDIKYLDYCQFLINKYKELTAKLSDESLTRLNHSIDDKPYYKAVARHFDFYRDLENVIDMLNTVLPACANNDTETAYKELFSFFTKDNYYYLGALPRMKMISNELYRCRKDSINKTNGDGELFHIPYNLRHIVGSMRYSIPGKPMLYLANNLFTAWCELDKPAIRNISFAKFRFKNEVGFLDLSYPYTEDPQDFLKYSLFVFYPLLMACMISVKHPSTGFTPEYVLPQLMTRLVQDTKRHTGIVYMSSKIPRSSDINSIESRNYAIITNQVGNELYDNKLAQKMEMTNIHSLTLNDEERIEYYNPDKKTFMINFEKITENDIWHDIKLPDILHEKNKND